MPEQEWSRYDRLATIYDVRMRAVVPGYDLMHDILAAHMLVLLPETARVMVAGAGTGNELVRLAQMRPSWQLTGVEPSRAMSDIAESKIEAAKVRNVTLIRSSIFDFSPDFGFDGGCLSLVLQLFDRAGKVRLLRRLRELLKPGAPLLLFDTCTRESAAAFALDLKAMARQNIRHGLEAEDADENAATLADRFHLITPEATELLLGEAGFANVQSIFRSFVTCGWVAFFML